MSNLIILFIQVDAQFVAPRVVEFMDMNEDCIAECMRYLSITDLAVVAETCTFLESCAKSIFQRVHKCHLKINYWPGQSENVHRVLRVFGHLATAVTCISNPTNNGIHILRQIAFYCSNGDAKVKHLHLQGLIVNLNSTFTKEDLLTICRLASKLKRIAIVRSTLWNCELLFRFAEDTLEHLTVEESALSRVTLDGCMRYYPKLRTLEMVHYSKFQAVHLQRTTILRFLQMNPSIRHLKLLKSTLPQSQLEAVFRLQNLRSLEIQLHRNNDLRLVNTSHLRALCIHSHRLHASRFVNAVANQFIIS